ncbi:MAG: nucleoside monophosphate kinase [Candidatus Pacebacteria bacterium]|nr:nucleoside monophosphate kinase [Candidatus Paceibacterota bacterium]
MEFPLFRTKTDGADSHFDLSNPKDRQEYFKLKAGPEIEKIKKHIAEGYTFIAYLMGKKSSGKGTFAKMFIETIGSESVDHFSIGDMIRTIDKELQSEDSKKALIDFLKINYRGWLKIEDIMKMLNERSTKTLLPTDLILTLVKREIEKREKKVIFIDGFPRDMDQISYSLFFRDLIGYRDDPDLFILIDVPNDVINERIKFRRICPKCKTSRNLKLLPTSKIKYENGNFTLLCDNPECDEIEMVGKEGDELGIEPIRTRLETDEKLIKQAFSLYGIPKILLRNAIPVEAAKDLVDNYEVTPEFHYRWNESEKRVEVDELLWTFKDKKGSDFYSLMPPPVVVSLIHQMVEVLDLS